MKICTKCKYKKKESKFYRDRQKKDNLTSWCKNCCDISNSNIRKTNPERHRVYVKISQKRNPKNTKRLGRESSLRWQKNHRKEANANASYYRALRLHQTPAWANLKKIKQIYINCPRGKEVDHIIPLQGKVVSGFHYEKNLQYLTPKQNKKKGNKI